MAKEIKNQNAEAVVEAVSKTEQFFNENGKLLGGILAGLVILAVAAFCWVKFAYQPAVAEAQGQMALAEQNFRAADYEVAGSDTFLLKGDGIVRVAGLSVGYMSIPGHTHDSLVYKIGQIIFTGDTLTAGLIGETSSSYSHNTLLANINSKILSQQTDIILMPGHGPPSSVEAERHFNKSFAK